MIGFIAKYINSGSSVLFYVAALIMAALFCIIGYYSQVKYRFGDYSQMKNRSLQVHFFISTEQSTTFDIYYDVGQGLNENDHQSKKLEKTGRNVKVSFNIPVYNNLKVLRFDPAKGPVEMSIEAIKYAYGDSQLSSVPLKLVQPTNQILSHSVDNNVLHFKSLPDANDPSFIIGTDLSPAEKTKSPKILYYLKYFFAGIITAFFFRFMYLYFFKGK